MGCPGGSDDKESACSAGDLDSIPRLGRSPEEGHGNPLQYSGQDNPMFDLIHMTLQCHHFLRSHFVFLHSFCVLFNLHTFSTNMWSQSFKLSNTVIANDNIFISNIDIFVSIKNIYIYINKEFINIFYIFLIH